MEASLLSLQGGGGDTETLHAIFRCAHSMKAGAGTFGFSEMARFTHVLETLLDQLRSGELKLSRQLIEILLRSVDVERALVAAAAKGEDPPVLWEEVVEELDRVRGAGRESPERAADASPRSEQAAGAAVYAIEFFPGPD